MTGSPWVTRIISLIRSGSPTSEPTATSAVLPVAAAILGTPSPANWRVLMRCQARPMAPWRTGSSTNFQESVLVEGDNSQDCDGAKPVEPRHISLIRADWLQHVPPASRFRAGELP
jgi:hypothetical protein